MLVFVERGNCRTQSKTPRVNPLSKARNNNKGYPHMAMGQIDPGHIA